VGASASPYAKKATATIPIVFMYVPDPVRNKLVESLARPAGNVTGLTNYAVELTGLRLQFLKELVPGLSRVAFLVNPDDDITASFIDQAQAAAAKLRITVQVYEARTLDALEPAFDAMAKARMQAVTVAGGGLFFQGRARIAKLALARRMPICGPTREYLESGTLMSYGPDQVAISRRTAVYVDKILKGAKPGDIPVEIPTKFELLINAKIAQGLGLKIPQTLSTRADEVIR
jgi:putative ABC transport system substrate-binding protein